MYASRRLEVCPAANLSGHDLVKSNGIFPERDSNSIVPTLGLLDPSESTKVKYFPRKK